MITHKTILNSSKFLNYSKIILNFVAIFTLKRKKTVLTLLLFFIKKKFRNFTVSEICKIICVCTKYMSVTKMRLKSLGF
jgi:hypothetical protein